LAGKAVKIRHKTKLGKTCLDILIAAFSLSSSWQASCVVVTRLIYGPEQDFHENALNHLLAVAI